MSAKLGSSIAQQIAELNDPSPALDPEDEFGEGTRAKLLPRSGQDDGTVDSVSLEAGRIRRRAALSLEETDTRYKGRTASRRNLDGADSGESASSTEEDSDGGDLESFRELMKHPIKDEDVSTVDNSKYVGQGDEESDSGSESEEENDPDVDSDDVDADDDEDDEDGGGDVDDKSDSDIEVVTRVNLSEEIEKGLAAKNQQGLWDNFLEARIKLQKGLQLANQLPQYTTHHSYIAMGEHQGLLQDASASRQKLRRLLRGLLKLQDELLLQNDGTKHIVTGEKANSAGSDEEIPSGEEEIGSDEDQPTEKEDPRQGVGGHKRKIDLTNPGEEIAKRHRRFEEFRNTAIHSWYDKTKLASGRLSSQSFSALEKSPVDQVQQIMMDKARLIHRTQLKRSTYKVISQSENTKRDTPPEESDEVPATRSSTMEEVDPEIFDDDDFYHQLLKELIERKSANTTDPAQLTRQWLTVQKLRSKVKKVVDTRASKGRKLRYNIHPKMVSFMAPKDESTMTDEARNGLFGSLFGNIKPEIGR